MRARVIVPVLDREFPLKDVLAAQAYLAVNAQIGKLVLTVQR